MCETRGQIEAVFDGVEIEVPEPVIVTETPDPLAGELKRASDLLERIMALPVHEMPERKAIEPQFVRNYYTIQPAGVTVTQAPPAEVKVIVGDQPAPVINVVSAPPIVNVQVEPTPVQIQNEVIVKPSQSARVVRDINGKISGLEAE